MIRLGTTADLAAASGVYRRASLSNAGDRDNILAHPEYLILGPEGLAEGRTYVAEQDGTLAGFATWAEAAGTLGTTGIMELEDLFVDPDYMRRGIAMALVDRIAEVLRARGAERLEVTANPHAMGFYRAAGFTDCGVVETVLRARAPRMVLAIGGVRIRGSRLLLRALRPDEIEEEWQAMVASDPMAIAELPQEAAFKARLARSGRLNDGWLDLAVDLDGTSIGRIQTFVPRDRPLPRGTFEIGIGLHAEARGQGHGREALVLLTDWLFEHAAAEVVEAPTDPANTAMRTVFLRAGWQPAGSVTDYDREWIMYRITRPEWAGRLR
jgi:RimJ/RimL family protein N-acetyltransferase/ribosomal protein S18 acetylase RimI-like enzyme